VFFLSIVNLLSCRGGGGDRAFLMLFILPNSPAKPLDALRAKPSGI